MSPELAYFLKANLAIAIFYAFYRLFFYKDTFFRLRRIVLLSVFAVAFLYPLLNIQEWIKEQEPIAEVATLYATMLPETTATMAPLKTNWLHLISSLLLYTYIGGLFLLLTRFFIQLGSIFLLASRSRKETIQNISVYLLKKPAGPFSFFSLIFIHPESHNSKETEEILAHETTHVRQYHSVDVIISELLSIICWVNPFVWLLKREVRHNLEYLADNTVIQAGYDSKSYQYHLLGLAHHRTTANLYNSFNVLPLKNRISMMNKKRSRSIGQTKYLMFVPLVAMLMLLSNIEAVARVTRSFAEQISTGTDQSRKITGKVVDENKKPIIAANIIIQGTTSGTITDIDGNFTLEAPVNSTIYISYIGMDTKIIPAKDITNGAIIQLTAGGAGSEEITIYPTKKYDQVFTVVENMPQYPGGVDALLSFISKNIKYPTSAKNANVEGRVITCFVVDADGSVTNPEIMRGVNPALDREALRVISEMPKWTPGTQRGKAVPVKYTMPITFSLGSKPTKSKSPAPTVSATNEKGENQIFTVVESMPQFPEGDAALLKFLSNNIKYPADALKEGIQGRVITSFIVNIDGSISNPAVIQGISPSLDKEAIRVLNQMPKWKPGTQRGKTVAVKYTVPITFRIPSTPAPAPAK